MSDGTWLDPWLAIREKTALRNDIQTVADRYSKIQHQAILQLNDLRARQNTSKGTIDGLEFIIRFCGDKGAPLWDKIQQIDTQLYEETERLNHE